LVSAENKSKVFFYSGITRR